MKGELSQMVWTVTAINAYLANRLFPNDFFPVNPVFLHCQDVQFVHDRGWLGGKKIAEEPRLWLRYLRDHGATRAFLHYTPPGSDPRSSHHIETTNGSAGHWQMLVDYP